MISSSALRPLRTLVDGVRGSSPPSPSSSPARRRRRRRARRALAVGGDAGTGLGDALLVGPAPESSAASSPGRASWLPALARLAASPAPAAALAAGAVLAVLAGLGLVVAWRRRRLVARSSARRPARPAAAFFDVRRARAAVFSGAWKSGTAAAAVGNRRPRRRRALVGRRLGRGGLLGGPLARGGLLRGGLGGLAAAAPVSASVAGPAVAAAFLVGRACAAVVFFAGAGVSPPSAPAWRGLLRPRCHRCSRRRRPPVRGLLGGPLAGRGFFAAGGASPSPDGLGGGGTVLLIVEHVAPRPGRCVQPRTCPTPTARVVRADGAKPSVAATPSAGASLVRVVTDRGRQASGLRRCHRSARPRRGPVTTGSACRTQERTGENVVGSTGWQPHGRTSRVSHTRRPILALSSG